MPVITLAVYVLFIFHIETLLSYGCIRAGQTHTISYPQVSIYHTHIHKGYYEFISIYISYASVCAIALISAYQYTYILTHCMMHAMLYHLYSYDEYQYI